MLEDPMEMHMNEQPGEQRERIHERKESTTKAKAK